MVTNYNGAASASSQGKKGFLWLCRGGYAAKGVVYGTVGVLALMTVFGFVGGKLTGARGAINTLGSQAFGQSILTLIAVGLFAYTLWRLTQAFLDPDRKGADAKGLFQRAGLLISGVIYAGLGYYAIALAFLSGGSSSAAGSSTEQQTATLMSRDYGVWLVGLTGAVVIGVGIYQGVRAWRQSFTRYWKVAEMGADERTWAIRISSFGLYARGAAFILIGWFLVQAALTRNPQEARSLDGALAEFASGAGGTVWLAIVAAGFICYGIYCFVNARYRRISID